MERLTQQDFHALLECLRSFYTPLDLEGFTGQVLSAIPQVVPLDVGVTYSEMNPSRRRFVGVSEPAEIMASPENYPIYAQYQDEHPFIGHYQRTRNGRAVKISDFLTQDQYHRLGLYNEMFRPMGVEHQMAIGLPAPPPLLIGITLGRSQTDFSERDRLVLDLLRPHLTQAYHNAEALGQMQQVQAGLGQAMEASDQGVILLTREGRVQWMTKQARRWLTDYFGKRIRGDRLLSLRPGPTHAGSSKTSFPRGDPVLSLQAQPGHPHLPEELERWVQAQRARLSQKDQVPPPREPLVIEREGRRLRVRLVEGRPEACPGPRSGELPRTRSGACPGLDPGSFPLLLLEEEHTAFSATSLESLGLGRREAEVLFWVAQGKTNPEAALILGVSPRTVQKHLERIYQKLDVPTRTAAITQALEALGLIKE